MNKCPVVSLCLALALVGGPGGVAVGPGAEPPARQGKEPVYRSQPLGHWSRGPRGRALGPRFGAGRAVSAPAGRAAGAGVPALVAGVAAPDAGFRHVFAPRARAGVGPAAVLPL